MESAAGFTQRGKTMLSLFISLQNRKKKIKDIQRTARCKIEKKSGKGSLVLKSQSVSSKNRNYIKLRSVEYLACYVDITRHHLNCK